MKKPSLHGFYTGCRRIRIGFARPSDIAMVADSSKTAVLYRNIGLKWIQLDNPAETQNNVVKYFRRRQLLVHGILSCCRLSPIAQLVERAAVNR